jgi:hypothetical protein
VNAIPEDLQFERTWAAEYLSHDEFELAVRVVQGVHSQRDLPDEVTAELALVAAILGPFEAE